MRESGDADSGPRPLDLSEEAGRLNQGDVRLALMATDALCRLRNELYEILGPNLSHEALFRFGFHDGSCTALAVRSARPGASRRDLLLAGPPTHEIRGLARVVVGSIGLVDGIERITGTWEDSFEADHSLETYGVVDRTVCWLLTGFASGYASEVLERDMVCVERTCRAKGDAACGFEVLPADDAPALAEKVRALRRGTRLSERFEPEITRLWEKAFSSSTYLAQILKDSADAIVSVDANEVIQTWNRGARQLFGYSPDEVVGRHFRFLVPPDLMERGEIEKVRRETSEKGSLRNYETRRLHKDGREVHVSLTRTSIYNLHGEYAGASAILRDITERKRLVEQLIQAESLAEVGELAAQVAHEIKNPLAGISGAIQLLASDVAADDVRSEIFNQVLQHIDRLDRTVRSLLDFTQPYRPQKMRTPIGMLLDSAESLLHGNPEWRNVEILRDVPAGIDTVDVDPQLFSQVLLNLFLNAAQADGGNSPLEVIVSRDARTLRIDVMDQGGGMDPKTLEDAFRPFHTTRPRGTGLGLPIARKIMEAHGGSIELRSKPGAGTRVILLLPD